MTKGTTPPGARGEEEAARWVRRMFAQVARRYDLLNHVLSFNRDRRWRAHTASRLSGILKRPGARIMDLCCGTGDLIVALAGEACPEAILTGSDFCHPMLEAARRKLGERGIPPLLVEADALSLPLPDGVLDLVTAAFGFRNLANYRKGLGEMRRVLKPSGLAAILEFSQPQNRAFAAFYSFYSRRVLPAIGGAVSGSRDAYEYLPESVRKFPGPEGLAEEMRCAGFREVEYELLSGGIVALHTGKA